MGAAKVLQRLKITQGQCWKGNAGWTPQLGALAKPCVTLEFHNSMVVAMVTD